ncbi:hypothetical protein Cni_G24559 [Canna indica]|uniref:MBD domain-containing protein n=1 Tax=Canna indica TaxID=4628 RepID=A0AAQ3QNB1_9LILI|nr:hypothetical protein Cni_G24559 [Canna indica]
MKPNVSCEDASEVEPDDDDGRVWAADIPNLPRPPAGTQRVLNMRSDFSRVDVYYVMPNGHRLRSSVELARFLEEFPEYRSTMSPADFSFATPKINKKETSSSPKSKKFKTQN